jgi:hypothetical protein
MKTFTSKKGSLTLGVFGFTWCILLMIFLGDWFWDDTPGLEVWPLHIFSAVVAAFLLWLWLDTSYDVSKGLVNYRSGPFRGSIAIHQIKSIQVGKTQWVGIKPALAQKGLILAYGKWDEIYFSPADQKGFIEALLEQNPAIKLHY